MLKRFIAVFLCLILCASFLTSCGDSEKIEDLEDKIKELEDALEDEKDEEEPEKSNAVEETWNSEETFVYETVTTASALEETLPIINSAGLPDYDFGGYEFNILSVGRNGCVDDFAADENSTEILDQAIYTRNLRVESLYNVKLNTIWRATTANQQSPEGYQTLVREATAGDINYDICVIPGYDVSELAYGGFLTDLNSLPYFDGTKSYYDQKANETFTFGDALFFTAGDYGINIMNQTNCIAFNKKLAEDYKLGDFYNLVETKQWTLEKMSELAKKVASPDLGVYGNLYWTEAMYAALNASGEKLVTLDEETLNYELSGNNEIACGVISDFFEMVMDESVSYKYQHNSLNKEYINIFSENKALFFLTTIGSLFEFRGMDTDFGILPYFLYSENQTEYHNTVAPFYMNFMCVPLIVENYERTSAIMEAIGYYSEREIIPAYYDKTLRGEYVRDTASSAMLDIIFDTRAYDIGYCYQPAHMNKQLIYMLNDGTNDWPVRYERLNISTQAMLDVISEYYRGVVNS